MGNGHSPPLQRRPYKVSVSLTREGGELLEALMSARGVNASAIIEMAVRQMASTSRIKSGVTQ